MNTNTTASFYTNPLMRLENNHTGSVMLTFMTLVSYFLCYIFGEICSLFFSTVFIEAPIYLPNSSTTLVSFLSSFIFMIFFVYPIKVNIQKWYLNLDGNFSSVLLPFKYFSSLKIYLTTVFYSFIRSIIVILSVTLPFLPTLIIFSIMNVMLNKGYVLAIPSGILIIFAVLLAVFAIFIAIRLLVNTLFMGTIYNMNIETNPFKIYSISRKLVKKEEPQVLFILMKVIPYFLLSILILPIPFTVPIIMTIITGFTKNTILINRNMEVNHVNP